MYRLCYVDNWQRDHQKAIFHKWIDNTIHKKNGETILQTLALVEFEDGTLARVDYTSIKFEDTKAYFNILKMNLMIHSGPFGTKGEFMIDESMEERDENPEIQPTDD